MEVPHPSKILPCPHPRDVGSKGFFGGTFLRIWSFEGCLQGASENWLRGA